eukprot:5626429-Heterocapsa_arctica.AAC.1
MLGAECAIEGAGGWRPVGGRSARRSGIPGALGCVLPWHMMLNEEAPPVEALSFHAHGGRRVAG